MGLGDILGGVGGIIGDVFGGGEDRQRADDMRARALMELQGLRAPDLDALIRAGTIGPTEYDKIQADPALRGAQVESLRTLQDIGRSGGMRLEDKARLNQALARSNMQERANRLAILQGMQSRGLGGSGAELAANLSNEQGIAQRNAMTGEEAAAQGSQRALAATTQAGQLGGQIRGQDYSEAARRAAAQDAINRYNAATRTRAYEGDFDRRARIAAMRYGGYRDRGSDYQSASERPARVGSAIGHVVGGIGDYAASAATGVPSAGGGGGGGDEWDWDPNRVPQEWR